LESYNLTLNTQHHNIMAPVTPLPTPQKERSTMSQNHKDMLESTIPTYGPRVFEDVGAFEAKLGDKHIFTRALLQGAADQMELIRAGDPSGSKEPIRMPHILGDGVALLKIPAKPSSAVGINWHNAFNSSA
jgi:hypothetical protein